jgi:uncharacterized membrane protein YbhN (UPF0104 family)
MSENKNKRNKLAITLLKYLFFFGTLVFIYFKVFRYHSFAEVYHQFSNTLNVSSGLYFTAAFFMMFINWGLEAEKWRLMMHRTYYVSFFTALKATFAGTSFGIFTPNRSGSFLGNMIFVPHPYKAEAAITVWISSMSQFLATVTFGFMGLLAVKYFDFSIPLGEYGSLLETGALLVLMVILSLGYLAYFNTNYFINLLGKFKWVNRLIDKLEKVSTLSKRALFYYWILSMVRYVVFVVQFFLVFKGFNVHIPFLEFFVIVCLLYAFITFIPSVLGKLGVREAAMLVLLSASGYTDIQILSGSFGLWMLNVILPALLGAVFILKQPLIDKE